MNKMCLLLSAILCCSSIWGCNHPNSEPKNDTATSADSAIAANKTEIPAQETAVPRGAQALMKAYPNKVVGYESDSLVFADGTKMRYNDEKEKDFVTRLDDSDAEDMFLDIYDTNAWTPAYLQDAGRSRCEALFRKMYGNSQSEVAGRLVSVKWFGQNVRFTSECGAADSLCAVACELEKHPELHKYLTKASSFYWRNVRGAKRLSAHSYGIAVDINVAHSDYWLWKNPKVAETAEISYTNRIPRKIVEIFERHGFIWGGRWYHFDTMHFEFRPEFHAYNALKIAK